MHKNWNRVTNVPALVSKNVQLFLIVLTSRNGLIYYEVNNQQERGWEDGNETDQTHQTDQKSRRLDDRADRLTTVAASLIHRVVGVPWAPKTDNGNEV